MAIAFTDTAVAETSAAIAAATIQTAWRTALTGHVSGAWTLVEEFASASINWVIVKNSTVVSGVGADFHVIIGRVISSGELMVFVAEGYDTATKAISAMAGQYTTSAIAIDADGKIATTFVLGTTVPLYYQEPMPMHAIGTPPASVRALSAVESTHAIFAIPTLHAYVGQVTSLITGAVADPPAICMMNLNVAATVQGPDSGGSLTRHPLSAARTAGQSPPIMYFPNRLLPIGVTSLYAMARVARSLPELVQGTYFSGDRLQGNRYAASEILAVMTAPFCGNYGNIAPSSVTGALRGKFKSLRYASIPPTMAFADTVVIDGFKHARLEAVGLPSEAFAGGNTGQSLALLVNTELV